MEGTECLPVGHVTSSECLGRSDLSQKAAAYASERLMIRAAEEMEAKMRAKMESLQKQLEDYRMKHGALEKSHEELKTLHEACKANLDYSIVNQKRQYEEVINRLKGQVAQLEQAAIRVADLDKQAHEHQTTAESLRVQNTALRDELDKLVEAQNHKQAQSSKEKARLREEAGRQQARAFDLEAKNEQLTRQLDKLKKELTEVALERETFGKTVTAEMDDVRQQAQDATEKARESERKALEKAESFRVQLQQIQTDSKQEIQRMQDLITRQTQQVRDAEEHLRRQQHESEELFSKLKRDTDQQIAAQDAEKRRALSEAMQRVQALQQEDQKKSAQLQELQEQCQRLAYQRASAQAKCEDLSKRAEGIQADCERRVGEFDRLQADFRALEESHRNLLGEMETLTTAKEEAAAKLISFQKQLDLRQLQAAELKKANQELQTKVTEAETAGEQLLRKLHHAVNGSQRVKYAARQKLEAAKKAEDELSAVVTMLRNRVTEITAERNGLWHAVVNLKNSLLRGDEITFESSAQPCSSTFANGTEFHTSQSNNTKSCPSDNSKSTARNSQAVCPQVASSSAGHVGNVCPRDVSSAPFFNMTSDISGAQGSQRGYARGGALQAEDSKTRVWEELEDLTILIPEQAPPFVAITPTGTSIPEYTEDFKMPE